jgi:coronin-7
LAYDGTSPLEPVVDSDRSIVYFTSRTSSALHWADLNASGTQGTQPLSFAAGGAAALAPVAPLLDVMRGEIAKLYVPSPPGAGGDAIVPVSVVVPRRQYIDFHSDLFPDTMDWRDTPHTAGQWLEGQNKKLAMLQLDPKLRKAAPEKRQPTQPMQSQAASVAAAAPIVPTAALPASMQQAQRQMPQAASGPGMAQSITPTPATAVAAETAAPSSTASQLSQPSQPAQPSQDAQPSSVETTACQAPSNGASAGSAARSSVPAPVRKTAAAQPAPTSSIRKTASAPRASPTGPRWSRRFVTASTPLISAYQSLSGLDISRAPDARMLAVSPLLFVVPLSGPGGRLGVHRLAQTGRLPAALPALSSGAAVLDFCVDPFGDARVIAAAEDGKVRVWEVASQAGETQPSLTLQLPGASRPGEIAPHPRAEGLFAIAPTDAEGQLHLLDIRSSASAPLASLDVPGGGAFSLAWRANGLHLALACKDRKLRVFDPRTGSSIAEVAAHASPRSFRVIWLDEAHLLSVGHGAGSARELQLFKFSAAAGLTAVAFTTLDVSPAVLFPHWDGDSQVLFLCAKSEPVAAYEVRVDAPRPADFFTALPAFQHGQPQLGLAFLPKQSCDVQAVEVARALRLTKSELMMVSWRVPRARPELFQDDVFPPTRVLQAATTARAWMEGEDGAEDSYEDLCPEGMQPRASLRSLPTPQHGI